MILGDKVLAPMVLLGREQETLGRIYADTSVLSSLYVTDANSLRTCALHPHSARGTAAPLGATCL
jgi:hypothetical protein